jgi:hypothetical protein
MAKFKDFGSAKAADNLPPISFKIYDEEFNCVKQLQGKVMLEFIAGSNSDDSSQIASMIELFFTNVLDDDSLKRFNALTHDKDRYVSTETLSEIVGWLVEQYSDRPEEQPEA